MPNILIGLSQQEQMAHIQAYFSFALFALQFGPTHVPAAEEGRTFKSAEQQFKQQTDRIMRVARDLQTAFNPLGVLGSTKAYRGIVLKRPVPEYRVGALFSSGLGGLDPHLFYSFTEDLNVACYFADPDGMGFGPGEARRKYGYVLSAQVALPMVLFHHSYLHTVPTFRANMRQDLFQRAVEQKEIIVLNSPLLVQRVDGYFPGPCDTAEYQKLRDEWHDRW